MRYQAISEARATITEFNDSTENTVLTRNGKPIAVLMPIAEYRALRALLKLSQNPAAAARVAEVHERVSSGDTNFEEVGTGKDSMPAPYERVKCDDEALQYVGRLPLAVAECLEQAFAKIRRGTLALRDLRPWRAAGGPLYTTACQHLIYGSEDPAGSEFVISAILLDDDEDVP